MPEVKKVKKLFEQKGVSPVVGTILLIAITVALAAVVATLVSGLGGRGTPPSAMLTVVARDTGENVTLTIEHAGGDDLVVADLQVKATKATGLDTVWNGSTTPLGAVGTTFTVGESGTLSYDYAGVDVGDVLTVYIIHVPSKQKIFSSTNVVVQA